MVPRGDFWSVVLDQRVAFGHYRKINQIGIDVFAALGSGVPTLGRANLKQRAIQCGPMRVGWRDRLVLCGGTGARCGKRRVVDE